MFRKRKNIFEIEEGIFLSPKFDSKGLGPVVTSVFITSDVLMLGYLNKIAFIKTIVTKEGHYWSRSRKALWHKGKISGFVQNVVELRIDDDQDAIWMKVNIGKGASCHVGYISCFYRSIPLGKIKNSKKIKMMFKEKKKKFNPEEVYKGQPNPTKL
jgi:phosphoribosyl-AMP cyclohydrolase